MRELPRGPIEGTTTDAHGPWFAAAANGPTIQDPSSDERSEGCVHIHGRNQGKPHYLFGHRWNTHHFPSRSMELWQRCSNLGVGDEWPTLRKSNELLSLD